VKTQRGASIELPGEVIGIDAHEDRPVMAPSADRNRVLVQACKMAKGVTTSTKNRQPSWGMPMLFLTHALPARFLPAILFTCFALAAHAGPVDCEQNQNKVALARVVTTEARLNFIAGRGERMPACPSAESACRLKTYLLSGDEVLVDATDGPYVCAFFKSQSGAETRGWLPRARLQIAPPEPAPARQWDGKWERDREAQIVIKSHQDEVEVSGNAIWGSYDPQRVKRGAIHVGELSGKGRPRGQTLAIGYDSDRSDFPRAKNGAPDSCAAKLELYGRYLVVEDNGGCGGMNVSFTGTYVRVKVLKRLGKL
jgi:hypothetical protein